MSSPAPLEGQPQRTGSQRAVKPKRPRSRHGLTAPLVKVRLQGFKAIDMRMAGARQGLAFRDELIEFCGGRDEIVPTTMKDIELAVRASMLLDAVDRWLFQQSSIVNGRTRTLLPVLVQRQAIAEHLAKLLDRLGYTKKPKPRETLSDVFAEIIAKRGQQDDRPQNETPSEGAA